jgi:guanosine-3',5'-bis(diphosphate) 3'-pyrophosphohydrolase
MYDHVGPLLEAVSFAARAHRHQLRKDGQTPYHAHVFRVCLILRDLFGITDRRVLAAAVLHDTVEDTTVDFDEISEKFGPEIAGWVAALSKDKRLPDDRREDKYMETLAGAGWEVKACKLADLFDNLTDSAHLSAPRRARTIARSRRYLEALSHGAGEVPAEVRRAFEIVSKLLTDMEREETAKG